MSFLDSFQTGPPTHGSFAKHDNSREATTHRGAVVRRGDKAAGRRGEAQTAAGEVRAIIHRERAGWRARPARAAHTDRPNDSTEDRGERTDGTDGRWIAMAGRRRPPQPPHPPYPQLPSPPSTIAHPPVTAPPAASPRVTKEQNDPYIPSRRRRSEYSVLVLIARAGASLEGVTVGGDRSRF